MPKNSKFLQASLARWNKRAIDIKQNKKIHKLQKQVSTLVKADEKKWYDYNVTGTAITTSGAVQPLLNLSVYAGDNALKMLKREGNTIVLKSLKIDGLAYINITSLTPDSDNIVRCMLVQMTDDNAATPSITDVLDSSDVNSFYKIGGRRRYSVLYDKRFYLQNPNLGGYIPVESFRKRFIMKAKIPKKGLKVTYSQGSISGNNPVENGMYVMFVSDSGTLSHPLVKYKGRARFLDN